MCKIMEEATIEVKIKIATEMLKRGITTNEIVAEITGLSLEKVKELSEQLKPASA